MIGELLTGGLELYSALQASKGQKDANESQQVFNAAEAQKQRDFEERMAKTRYQYTRQDLEAAGYNPLLALNMNPPIPSGSSASANPQSTTAESSKILSNSAKNISEVSTQAIQRTLMAAEASSAASAARIAKQTADITTSKWGKRLDAYRYALDKTGIGRAAANIAGFFGAGKIANGMRGAKISFGNPHKAFYGSGPRYRYRPDRYVNADEA